MTDCKPEELVGSREWFAHIGDTLQVSVETLEKIYVGINTFSRICHMRAVAGGWWTNKDGTKKDRNKGEMLMLMVSEIAECMEGERKNLMDDKLPHRKMAEVEIGDLMIRAGDYGGKYNWNLGAAILEKMAYNAIRADHKPEARNAAGGKSF